MREVKEKMTALFRKLESPALTDIAIDWPGGADAWPRLVPDLYAGEPVVVTAQFPAGTLQGNVAISGSAPAPTGRRCCRSTAARRSPAWRCCGRARRSTR